MGSTLGIWEFLSQTNNNTDFIPLEDRYKFVDDLTALEIINLLNIGLASHNYKSQVPNDVHMHSQVIESQNLKSQQYLQQIDEWADKQKMIVSQQKTKAMVINFTDKYQFSTRLQLKGENIEIVDKMKILGTFVNDKLTWEDNCNYLLHKVNMRMELLRKAWSFGATQKEMVHLWMVFCRSILEQSCVVWNFQLTKDNINDFERTQKSFLKLIFQEKYISY